MRCRCGSGCSTSPAPSSCWRCCTPSRWSFRIFSLSPRPKRSWVRDELTYVGRRESEGAEQVSLFPDHVVISCRSAQGEIELAMSPGTLTGFQAWLEARPPGAEMPGSRGTRR